MQAGNGLEGDMDSCRLIAMLFMQIWRLYYISGTIARGWKYNGEQDQKVSYGTESILTFSKVKNISIMNKYNVYCKM